MNMENIMNVWNVDAEMTSKQYPDLRVRLTKTYQVSSNTEALRLFESDLAGEIGDLMVLDTVQFSPAVEITEETAGESAEA